MLHTISARLACHGSLKASVLIQSIKSYGPSYTLLYEGQQNRHRRGRQFSRPFTKFAEVPTWSLFVFLYKIISTLHVRKEKIS